MCSTHIMELSLDFTMEELNALRSDLKNLSPEQASRRRQKNLRLVYRLAPGRSCQNFAMSDPSGIASSDPHAMIETLRNHWGRVFSKRETSRPIKDHWLKDDFDGLPGNYREHLP